jgi:hypothetical protein
MTKKEKEDQKTEKQINRVMRNRAQRRKLMMGPTRISKNNFFAMKIKQD